MLVASSTLLAGAQYFTPQHRLSGIGADRAAITPAVVEERTERMIQSQTFVIMRHPEATAGAERVTGPGLTKIIGSAAKSSGLPASLISAVAYLESWGDAEAVSPAGPKGIMQFSEATARAAGLQVVRVTRYQTTKERRAVRTKSGKTMYRTVRRRIPYVVTVRDDRLTPERAVPATARYLARLQTKFGGLDWAIFAYHCGEGCVADLFPMAQAATGREQPTVAEMFFAAHPALHTQLYDAIRRQMQRDYSPTYWFRIQRAEQLLKLYQADPAAFRELAAEYRNPENPQRRADNRLMVWFKTADVDYRPARDFKAASDGALTRLLDDPMFFGVTPPSLPGTQELLQDSPSAIGSMLYIAFETRRLFEALKPKGERFVPLRMAKVASATDREAPESGEHSTGQVFAIDQSNLGRAERQCLNFTLEDLGWDGHVGFFQDAGDTLHIGAAPSSREFFAAVFQEALDAKLEAGASELPRRAPASESLR